MPLKGKRAYSKNDAPLRRAWQRIRWTHPRAQTNALVARAASHVRKVASTYANPCFAWSGGKDSLALQAVCQKAGLERCVMFQTRCEFPSFIRWVNQNAPPGLEIVYVEELSEQLILDEPHWLFHGSEYWSRWAYRRFRGPFRTWRAENSDVDIVFVGHRALDHNFLMKPDRSESTAMGRMASPVWDWTHEEVMASIYWSNLSLPPNYDHPNGWYDGPCSWPQVNAGSLSESWNRLWHLDPELADSLHPDILERCKPLIRE